MNSRDLTKVAAGLASTLALCACRVDTMEPPKATSAPKAKLTATKAAHTARLAADGHAEPSKGSAALAHAAPAPGGHGSHAARVPAHEILGDLLRGNDEFIRRSPSSHFAPFRDTQKPRATVVGCSDSRFHTLALEREPDNDLFVVRNVGNQLGTSMGSVTYGLRHLDTALLLVVGHVGCGAIKAAMGDYGDLERSVRQEVDGLHLSLAHGECLRRRDAWSSCVRANVHEQVRVGMLEFSDLVKSGQVAIVGLVYDFRNELGLGHGRAVIVNVNGERGTAALAASPLVVAATARAGLQAPPLRKGVPSGPVGGR